MIQIQTPWASTKDLLGHFQLFSPLRKIHTALSLCCLLVILCAFSSASPMLVLTAANNGTIVRVSPGTRILIRLVANPSTGYSWRLATPNSPMLTLQSEKYIPHATVPGRPPIVGAPGIMEFTFIAHQSGIEQLRFVYQRPWEKQKPAITQFTVTIHVRTLPHW